MYKVKIMFLVFLASTIMLVLPNAFSQSFGDVEISTTPLQGIEKTNYGYVIHYTNTKGYRGTVYMPNQWFRRRASLRNTDQESAVNVSASLVVSYVNLNTQTLTVKYIDGKVRFITILITDDNLQYMPNYLGTLTDSELRAKFEEQKTMQPLINTYQEELEDSSTIAPTTGSDG